MKKSNKVDNSAIKNIVEENIKRMEKVQISDVMEIIRPLYAINPSELVERELKTKARYIINSFKDRDGVRIFYSDNEGAYINIEQSKDVEDLSKVHKQLSIKYSGIVTAMKKVKARIKTIMPGFKFKQS